MFAQASDDPWSVSIDTGGAFFGSSLFFPTFKGAVTRELFAKVRYDAWGLDFRDFNAGVAAGKAGV